MLQLSIFIVFAILRILSPDFPHQLTRSLHTQWINISSRKLLNEKIYYWFQISTLNSTNRLQMIFQGIKMWRFFTPILKFIGYISWYSIKIFKKKEKENILSPTYPYDYTWTTNDLSGFSGIINFTQAGPFTQLLIVIDSN